MNHFKVIILSGIILLFQATGSCTVNTTSTDLLPGAYRTEMYFPLLTGKQIAVVANHTSLIGDQHLVDSLLKSGFKVVKIFTPEHGFRGVADAGEKIRDDVDPITGLPVVSLYSNKKKPTPEDLRNVDIVIFDLQDVGARFYTYISTMTYVMEACAENDIPMIVLDRPNPNGYYVDGPVLQAGFESFVGLHPVPVVHGMTVGEYALMVNGEGWLKNGKQCQLTIIPVKNYTHKDIYQITVSPSPNLPTPQAVYLYPSLCFFEGTVVSVGRGTDKPFQIIGHPSFSRGTITFTPQSKPGASNPPHRNTLCYGIDLTDYALRQKENPPQINLSWLIEFYHDLKDQTRFFNNYFDKLAGNSDLRKQIEAGMSEEEIRQSWQNDLKKFKVIRKKYLLYPDFE